MNDKDKELERVLQDIRYDRQMRKKRLYEQAKRKRKQEAERVNTSNQ